MLATIDWTNLSLTEALMAAAIPVVLGGVTAWLNIFIEPEKDFRQRARFKRVELLEGVSIRHTELIEHARRLSKQAVLRGDGHNDPDRVGAYNEQVFRLFTIFHRLETLALLVRAAYWVLFSAIAIGVIGLIASWIASQCRPIVFWCAVILILVELVVIAVVKVASNKLSDYEDVV